MLPTLQRGASGDLEEEGKLKPWTALTTGDVSLQVDLTINLVSVLLSPRTFGVWSFRLAAVCDFCNVRKFYSLPTWEQQLCLEERLAVFEPPPFLVAERAASCNRNLFLVFRPWSD